MNLYCMYADGRFVGDFYSIENAKKFACINYKNTDCQIKNWHGEIVDEFHVLMI